MIVIHEEAHLRRLARRHDFRVCKSRSRTPGDPCFGRYHVVDWRNFVVDGCCWYEFELTLPDLAVAVNCTLYLGIGAPVPAFPRLRHERVHELLQWQLGWLGSPL